MSGTVTGEVHGHVVVPEPYFPTTRPMWCAPGLRDLIPDGEEYCEVCGQVLRIGAWPFCSSPSNPQGHARGCYGWHFGGK